MTMTTEASRSRFSVRHRLTAAVALLTALALVAVGLTLYVVESQRVERAIEMGLKQEIEEFKALQLSGKDPDTAKGFASADRILTVFLERNFPDANELLFAFLINGPPAYQGESDSRLQHSKAFAALVNDMKAKGGIQSLKIGDTEYRVAVQPVREGKKTGAFAVTHNVSASRSELNKLMITYGVVAAFSLLVIASLASFIAGRLLQPVRSLRETAQGITEGDLSARLAVTGNDDLSELQRTFNAMLDRLESAFVTQRELLDDAGHELRTPLTVLRGHLELLDADNPDDVRSTRALLLDEVDRMARLVGDLLILAKSRRPDFVHSQALDVATLTRDIMDKSRALGARTWILDQSAEVKATIDGQRITQAMLQLADNAVRHTSEDGEIHLGSHVSGKQLEFWVRDNGPGVLPEDREVIFERFRRADRNDDGFGLGLSIVSAIAEAHGGKVSLDNTNSGATFRISIPAYSVSLGAE